MTSENNKLNENTQNDNDLTEQEKIIGDGIYRRMLKISGHLTNSVGNNGLIYASFHFDKFNRVKARRNTLTRFKEFKIGDDFSGYKVFDFGSNTGGLSFEFIRRKADFVHGFEYSANRTNLCTELANYLGVEKSCQFTSIDLDAISIDEFKTKYGDCDILICCALNLYIKDKMKFYKLIAETTKEICYFESNDGTDPQTLIDIFKSFGFKNGKYLGVSKTDTCGRKIFVMDKKEIK